MFQEIRDRADLGLASRHIISPENYADIVNEALTVYPELSSIFKSSENYLHLPLASTKISRSKDKFETTIIVPLLNKER